MTASGMAELGWLSGRSGAPPRSSTPASVFFRPAGTHTMRACSTERAYDSENATVYQAILFIALH